MSHRVSLVTSWTNLTLYSHPDKVKLAVNETMEAVEAKFVEITKAYKSCVEIASLYALCAHIMLLV